MVREWLRLMANENVSPAQLDFRKTEIKLTALVKRLSNTVQKWRGDYDFSHEVKTAMDTCLACKACASQCPIKIDVPSFRAKFFHFYHSRYLRPAKDHIVANLEIAAPYMAKQAKFFNYFTKLKVTQTLVEKTLGMTDLPLLSEPNLQQQLVEIHYQGKSLEELEDLSAVEKNDILFIVQDPYTSYYDAKVVRDFVMLTQELGFTPILLPFKPNGKAMHIKGFLKRFSKTAQNQAEFLNRMAKLGIPLVGVDPAIVLSYRDEYKEALQEKRGDFHVLTAHEWLKQRLQNTALQDKLKNIAKTDRTFDWYLFPHCTESTFMPNSPKEWQEIFGKFGQQLNVEKVGCCGMAGVFGHEVQNQKMSREIYDVSWHKKLHEKDPHFCLATGYSCRSQVKRYEHVVLKHPVQALLEILA